MVHPERAARGLWLFANAPPEMLNTQRELEEATAQREAQEAAAAEAAQIKDIGSGVKDLATGKETLSLVGS